MTIVTWRCVICNDLNSGYGNNPAPVRDTGRCCNDCNAVAVIPARLEQIFRREHEE
jgi:hypothetical protein